MASQGHRTNETITITEKINQFIHRTAKSEGFNLFTAGIAKHHIMPRFWFGFRLLFAVGAAASGYLFNLTSAFVPHTISSIKQNAVDRRTRIYTATTSTGATAEDELDALRKEIEELRQEALVRIEAVSAKADEVLSLAPPPPPAPTTTTSMSSSTSSVSSSGDGKTNTIPPPSKPSSQRKNIDVSETVHASDRALEMTYWKIALDIGREPGTWMPADWGVSGQRLNLQTEIQFRDEYVTDREDFLGGRGGKRVHVIQNDGVFGPGLESSAKHVRFGDGAWTISRGEGPAGTDLLRFYFELEERVDRGDLYCPAGRIYLTCGYFDIAHRGHSRKRDLEQKLDDLAIEYNDALDNYNSQGIFSLDRFKAWDLLQKKREEIRKTKDLLVRIQVMEPDLNLLRLSRKRDVAITNEGGACCKVRKGAG